MLQNEKTREVISADVHTRSVGTGVRVDVGYQDHRRTSNHEEHTEYMLDAPLIPDVRLLSIHDKKYIAKFSSRNLTIQSVRRRFWENDENKNFYKLLPGDDVIVKCAYSTREMIQPIFGGMNSHEELCFALITYVNQNRDEPSSDVGWAGEQDKHNKLQHSFDCNNTLW